MCKLQSARVHRPDNPQRLPHYDILRILPSNLRLESVRDPSLTQSLDTFWKRSGEDDVERELIVASLYNLRLSLPGVFEVPGLFEEVALSEWFSATCRRTSWKVPTSLSQHPYARMQKFQCLTMRGLYAYQTRDMPVRCNRMCLLFNGSDRQSAREPRKWALEASCSFPRKTI